MKKLRTIIIEDEAPARNIVRTYLSDKPYIELLGEYADGFSGLKAINELKPDLVFLDIQMPKLTGFEMLELIEHKPALIFTTAYDHFAIKAFEVNASDYLLKPFSKDRFDEALEKVNSRLQNVQYDANHSKNLQQTIDIQPEILHRIAVRSGNKINVIPCDKIIYIEAQGDYVSIHTLEEDFLKEKPMKFYEEHLDSSLFVRIHRSSIVNISAIDNLEYYDKESYRAILKNKKTLKVSTQGYRTLKQLLHL